MAFISYRKKMRIIAIVSVVVAAILAVALWFLISDYNKKAKIRRDELHLLDIEMYEEIKNNDNYFDADVTPADRELAEKMKNYNFYQKLEERMQVNVLFLGNEITDGIGVSDYTYRWVNRFVSEIEDGYGSDLKGYNYGKVNSDAFYGYNILNFAATSLTYDLVMICYGANDDPATFKIYYDGLLRSIKNQNSKCEIYCIIEANPEGYSDNAEDVRELCAHYGGICIDMNEYFIANKIDMSATLQGVLPNAEGNAAYYACISKVVRENLLADRQTKSEIKPNLSTTKSFDNYKVISREEMKQVSDTVFEFTARGNIATLIYNKSYTDGGTIKVYVNGKKLQTIDNKRENNTGGKEVDFYLIATGLDGVNKIRIETGTADNTLNFYGVALSGVK